MGTTRIHDLAAEFGISAEQLMGMLKEMDVFVRSHLSPLKDEQVALVRARWERDKRKAKEPQAPTKRRRAVKVAPAPEPEPVEARPKRRRRTAAEVAAAEAEAQAAAEVEALEEQRARDALEAAAKAQSEEKPAPSLEERAAALFKDLPRAVEPIQAPAASTGVVEPPTPVPSAPSAPPSPRPFIPTPVRPKPVASHTPGTPIPPRPVASGMPSFGGGSGSGGGPGGGGPPGLDDRRRDKGGKERKKGKKSVDQEAVAQNISRTLSALKGPVGRKGPHRREEGPSYRDIQEQARQEQKEREKTLVRVTEFITVSELASTLKVPPTQIVTFAFKELGQMVTINQRLDFDMIELIASAFGFQAVQEEGYVSGGTAEEAADAAETLKPRPPVVTVMGHVDHGKTSLLDYIRSANVVAGEAGGITQHIGAYHVTLKDGRTITFLDTPGHEAFTAMRARGAQVTDIVVLVVAADDAIMPQTIEAISHAKNAGVPLVVAINKIDLPSANVQKVKQDLLAHGVVLEEFGGTTLATPISAKKGTGVDTLLDQILLQAELLDLKANPDRRAAGAVLEATLDPGKGPVATILVQNGTLRVGEDFICGQFSGRVRALSDERGQTVKDAGPSIPVQILGFEGVPEAGDTFTVMEDASAARDIAQKRQRLEREAQHRRTGRVKTLEDFMAERVDGGAASLKIIIKADQGGPAEALADALAQLSTAEVKVEVVHRGVGAITDSDVLLAKASNAIIIGFHVRPDSNARASAERERVEIRTYRIIYEAVDEVKSAMEGLLAPEKKEVVLGEAEVRQIFKIAKVGTIAGSFVRSGVIPRTAKVRVVRNGVEVYDGTLASLKRFKDDAREVREGFECGIGVENFNDVKVGDLIEAYRIDEVARTLGGTAAKGA
ncbi:MAG TPA: translation initiation factor IF-2 [Gemmatimonadales bacterium]|nr:translation initiation factor IF-2 [Gemmatimonadales bacterium]